MDELSVKRQKMDHDETSDTESDDDQVASVIAQFKNEGVSLFVRLFNVIYLTLSG
jgi:hypothetical protein